MKQVSLLGSTGSIGESSLNVIAQHADEYKVFALSAHTDWKKLLTQCHQFHPQYAVIADPNLEKTLREHIHALGLKTVVLSGNEGLCMIAEHPEVEIVIAGIVGGAGLLPTLSAARAGKQILLANKEVLVMAGGLFMSAVKKGNATLLPLDSEHNALFQCLPKGYQTGEKPVELRRLILTASGGAFLHFSQEELENVTPEMACQHPNWKMGKKITVDCATLMNKGLEVIEAFHLFQCDANQLEVIIHPQSIIHSLVEYIDGSMLAQLSNPDMRIPIAYGLAWPARLHSGVEPLNLAKVRELTFYPPDLNRFPCLRLAMGAMKTQKAAPVVLNASNEVLVQAFLNGVVPFSMISVIIEKCLEKLYDKSVESLEAIIEIDKRARDETMKMVKTLMSHA